MKQDILSLDFWQDTVIYGGKILDSGTLGCDSLNIPSSVIAQLSALCLSLNMFMATINTGNGNPALLPAARESAKQIANLLKDVKPFSYRRVSDNLVTDSEGGSISASKSVTFGTEVSGDITGINISTSASITSEIGYTLNVGANKRVYMGYRVYYAVEKGTRELYDVVTGEVLRSNSYTVKVPQYGEYKLIIY